MTNVLDNAEAILVSLESVEDQKLKNDVILLKTMLQWAPGKENLAQDIVNLSLKAQTDGLPLVTTIKDLSRWWMQCLFLPSNPQIVGNAETSVKSKWSGLMPHPFRGLCDDIGSEITPQNSGQERQKSNVLPNSSVLG